jgi:hypothetical protein
MVEALEERNLLNASVAFDAAGNAAEVVVFNNGNAFLFTSTGNSQIGVTNTGSAVRVAHVFRDNAGKIGLDVVYTSGLAAEFNSGGSRVIGNNNVLDLSTAFDSKGNAQTDVVFDNGLGTGTGNLFEFTNSGSKLLASNATFATAFVDVKGNLGRAVGLFINPATNFRQAFTQDSTGTRFLYDDNGGDFVGDYDQSSPANIQNVATQTVSDVSYNAFGCFQFGPGQTVQVVGNDNVANF